MEAHRAAGPDLDAERVRGLRAVLLSRGLAPALSATSVSKALPCSDPMERGCRTAVLPERNADRPHWRISAHANWCRGLLRGVFHRTRRRRVRNFDGTPSRRGLQ